MCLYFSKLKLFIIKGFLGKHVEAGFFCLPMCTWNNWRSEIWHFNWENANPFLFWPGRSINNNQRLQAINLKKFGFLLFPTLIRKSQTSNYSSSATWDAAHRKGAVCLNIPPTSIENNKPAEKQLVSKIRLIITAYSNPNQFECISLAFQSQQV